MTRKIITRLLLLTIVTFIACEDKPSICPNCPGENDDNEKSAMTANISGAFNLKFDSESFEYHSYDLKEYKMREIVAKMYVDTANLEIRLTFNDFANDRKDYDFSGSDAKATITFYSFPAEYFQYNVNGTIHVLDNNNDDITATFSFTATTTNENRKLTVSQGVINYKRKTK